MQTMRTALVSCQVEALLGLRFWSVQEAAKLLVADAQYQQRSKNKVATRVHFIIGPVVLTHFATILFLKSKCRLFSTADHT